MSTDVNYIARSTRSDLAREGARPDAFALKACIDSLQRRLVKVGALAASYRAEFEIAGSDEVTETLDLT